MITWLRRWRRNRGEPVTDDAHMGVGLIDRAGLVWERGRWGTALERRLEQLWHHGPAGRAIKRLRNRLWDRSRVTGDRRWSRWANRLPMLYESGGTCWEWPWSPRTCNYCGGAHPDDVLRLMREGWEVEGTTKVYKRYLNPPGIAARYAEYYAGKPVTPGGWSPVPPVKIYVEHFTPAQVNEFNALLRSRRPDDTQ